jgi:hypothetical protein
MFFRPSLAFLALSCFSNPVLSNDNLGKQHKNLVLREDPPDAKPLKDANVGGGKIAARKVLDVLMKRQATCPAGYGLCNG